MASVGGGEEAESSDVEEPMNRESLVYASVADKRPVKEMSMPLVA